MTFNSTGHLDLYAYERSGLAYNDYGRTFNELYEVLGRYAAYPRNGGPQRMLCSNLKFCKDLSKCHNFELSLGFYKMAGSFDVMVL